MFEEERKGNQERWEMKRIWKKYGNGRTNAERKMK